MKIYGDINLNNHQAQQACFEVVNEMPNNPVMGSVVFKDKRVWICVQVSGSVIWVPMGAKHDTYVHDQTISGSIWSIEHNLNSMTPLVQVYTNDPVMVIPQSIFVVDENNIQISIGTTMVGKAVIMSGDTNTYGGLLTPSYTYEHQQSTPSSAWVIRHNLGYAPIVRVFDDQGHEFLPLDVDVDSIFQVTIRFTGPTIGTARLL
jgi:hypothetical protein